MSKIDLQSVDRLTPLYRSFIENNLSVQERKMLVEIVRATEGSKEFSTRHLKKSTGFPQTNHRATLLSRLSKKGVVVKRERGMYEFVDINLLRHLKVRCCNMYEE